MTLNDLTVKFNHLEQASILSDWEWLIGPDKLPILLTASGDAFVQDTRDGSIHVLDVGTASLMEIADSFEQFQSLLKEKEFVVNYFAVQMTGDLLASGSVLGTGQIYSLKLPLILGGEYDLSNIEATDIEVHFSISGQIHRQVSELPEGTRITGVSIK